MKNNGAKARKSLTNAPERASVALGSVMIRIHHMGCDIDCDTVAEAASLLRQLAKDHEARADRHRDMYGGVHWNASLFSSFVESLGDTQKTILSLLVRNQKTTDVDLRAALGLGTNQKLAGVLSGISKQAGALNVPARSIYTVEDERKSGVLTRTYAITRDFGMFAKEMNWPE